MRLYNFSNAPADGTLTLTFPNGKSESKSVNIPANGNSETAFTADFRAVLEKEGMRNAVMKAMEACIEKSKSM